MPRLIFSAMEAQDRPEFYVLIRWADGAERRVNHFARREDAERWIVAEAENWLRQRLGRPGFPPVADGSSGIVSVNLEVEDRTRVALALAA
jgi:hypothetical protein